MEHPKQKYNQRRCPRCDYILERVDTICPKCGKRTPVKPSGKPHLSHRYFDP